VIRTRDFALRWEEAHTKRLNEMRGSYNSFDQRRSDLEERSGIVLDHGTDNTDSGALAYRALGGGSWSPDTRSRYFAVGPTIAPSSPVIGRNRDGHSLLKP
jgi:hypothetical protein